MASSSSSSSSSSSLPKRIVDAHHHYIDTKNNPFQSFLRSLVTSNGPDLLYMPEDYTRDVVNDLAQIGITIESSVHVEAMPDNGSDEARWIESLMKEGRCPTVRAIVASCDLAQEDVDDQLNHLMITQNGSNSSSSGSSSGPVKGIRWILDCVGPFQKGQTATHAGTLRHDGIDYLRGSNGGYDGKVVPAFERGFSLLSKYGLTFDLQCAPAQLKEAAALFRRYPDIPVCIDHLAKPRIVWVDNPSSEIGDDETSYPKEDEISLWREGIQEMASIPHVYIKISMLGYIVPGWMSSPKGEEILKSLVLETVQTFGVKRCMIATNWWKDGAMSDSDGLSDIGPSGGAEMLIRMCKWFEDENAAGVGYTDEDREWLFAKTAQQFYRLG